jgi:hypothetical protein
MTEERKPYTLVSAKTWKDPGLTDAFDQLDYPPEWKPGKYRLLPDGLAAQVVRGGGLLVPFIEAGAREDKIVTPRTYVPEPGPLQVYKWLEGAKGQPLVECMCLDGYGLDRPTLLPESTHRWTAAGYPPEWYKGEIRIIPEGFYKWLKNDRGINVTTDATVIAERRGKQAHFERLVNVWRAKHTPEKLLDELREAHAYLVMETERRKAKSDAAPRHRVFRMEYETHRDRLAEVEAMLAKVEAE